MINKEAYELLVNGYADEILEKTAAAVKMPEQASKVWKKGMDGLSVAKNSVANASLKSVVTATKGGIKDLPRKSEATLGRAVDWSLRRRGITPTTAGYGSAYAKGMKHAKGLANVVAGSGLVAGGAYAAKRVNDAKTASEIVYDIMTKEAAGKPEIAEKIIKYVKEAPGAVYEATPKSVVNKGKAKYIESVNARANKLMAGTDQLHPGKYRTHSDAVKAVIRGDKIKLGLAGLGAAGAAGGYGVYRANNPVAEKAAELLVEAVMVKQAAYNEMENASICFDAGQSALDYMGYELD